MFSEQRINQVHLAIGATDLRSGIDSLAIIVQEKFKLDPFSRDLYVFCNKKQDKIKVLEWSPTGFWLHSKRLEKDRFKWPTEMKGNHLEIDERAFRWLLDGLTIDEAAHLPVTERQII